jgi:hypothetical protein
VQKNAEILSTGYAIAILICTKKAKAMIRIKAININNPVTGKLHKRLGHSVAFAPQEFKSELAKIKAMLEDRYPGMDIEIIMLNEDDEVSDRTR